MPAQSEQIDSPMLRAFAIALTAMRGSKSKNKLAAELGYTSQYIGQIEARKNWPSRKFAEDLDTHFNAGTMFVDLWELLDEHRDEIELPPGFTDFVEREAEASFIYIFGVTVFHGLFQTRDYATQIVKAGRAADEIERLVNKRMDRQEILTRDGAPRIVAIFDEAVVRRMIGGKAVMKAQLEQIINIAEMPNITLHVIPADDGAHPGVMGSFTLLRFSDAPEMTYTEGHVGGTLTDHPPTVATYTLSFDLIRGAAMSADDSLALLRAVLESL
ncbi:DUF5753 domain-containing protein [Actinocorallia sp. API 0066]|uniref:DUF5753 domain-containing protein n=1 Tax=Actinocorallia sp. API 0066 TaxID=2896846 RepID=UPI001E47B8C3|nr:DUF5753 domain-containing protein [Actinocorallia sp. API 0066]MCD0449372.1 DUF5753 domain-containing protein [Actinocorallia sp. API 0066]